MARRSFLDVRHPMFRPLWARVLAVAVVGGWAAFEAVSGAALWALLFGAAAAWLVWSFFVRFDPADYE